MNMFPPSSNGRAVIRERLQELLRRVVSRAPIKQAVISVETSDRSFTWTGATGESTRDGLPVRSDTPVFLASIDKLWNATIAMKLSERGQLDLDSRICTYLPPALTQGIHRLGGVDYSEQITVRHLLGHTSGLADWLEEASSSCELSSSGTLRSGVGRPALGLPEPCWLPRRPCSRDALDHCANWNAISVMWPRQYGFGPSGNNHATSPSIGTRTPPRCS